MRTGFYGSFNKAIPLTDLITSISLTWERLTWMENWNRKRLNQDEKKSCGYHAQYLL